jgi:Zn-dependent peptidase ImmA (M78 family)
MGSNIVWDNKSVLQFASGSDPIAAMESVAQRAVLEAVDSGWSGPPFDPLELAKLRGIKLRPNAAVADARIFWTDDGYVIDYNPNKPLGRVNFSIAHEIAHTFFDDCAEEVRNRSPNTTDDKGWQLEALCNVGAAEILMPVGSLKESLEAPRTIEALMELRRKFHVSTEAMLIRMVKMAKFPVVCFVASKTDTETYRLDYTISSSAWRHGRLDGLFVRSSRCFEECVAIGTTSKNIERWTTRLPELAVEAVGLPPYPGRTAQRIAGFALLQDGDENLTSDIRYLQGDASVFSKKSDSTIVHLVNNRAHSWGGAGFARSLLRAYPAANDAFRSWAESSKGELKLGNFHVYPLGDSRFISSLIAQAGYGESSKPRIRYSALQQSLDGLSKYLSEVGVSEAQMPRIGVGQAGGFWNIIEGIIFETLVANNISVKIYDLPPR